MDARPILINPKFSLLSGLTSELYLEFRPIDDGVTLI